MCQKNEFSQEIIDAIHTISFDHTHGSIYLMKKAIDVVISYTNTYDFIHPKQENIIGDYSSLLQLLITSQPQMAPIITFCNNLLFFLESIVSELKSEIIYQYCLAYKENIDKNIQQIVLHLPLVMSHKKMIWTYSSSSIVTQSLQYLKKQVYDFSVFCSESRPKNEGIELAETLQKISIPTTLVTDAYLLSYCSKADLILIGADSIYNNDIINKVGTFPLISLAKSQNIPIYVLCTLDKILPNDYSIPKEQLKPKDEITKKHLHDVSILNTYFDSTPLELITGIITEEGIIEPRNIQKRIHQKYIHPRLHV